MVIETKLVFNSKEIETIIKTLHILSELTDSDECTNFLNHNASLAFDYLSEILCKDEEGVRCYHNEGW